MIVFCYGTTAEAIKIAPIARRLASRGIPFEQWLTLQQSDRLLDALPGLGLPQPDRIIANGRGGSPLTGVIDVIAWLGQIGRWLATNHRSAKRLLGEKSVIIVHGDTMTSVIGALLARALGADCAHVEAGLRSGNWRHPFPEELDRRIVGRLAQIHYAPSTRAVAILQQHKNHRNVVFTQGNTVIDAILDQAATVAGDPMDHYGIVLLHRFEYLNNDALVAQTMRALTENTPHRLVMVLDDQARHALRDQLETVDTTKVSLRDKVSHADFVELLASASFVVTDSGGVQEETALLGIPTLVHRIATERGEGLGENAILSGWDIDTLKIFLTSYSDYRRGINSPEVSPSDIIVEDLVSRGYQG